MARTLRAHFQLDGMQLLVLQTAGKRDAPLVVTASGATHHRLRAIICENADVVLDVVKMIREGRTNLPDGAAPYNFPDGGDDE